jgi:hypothetical protein
MKAFCVRSAGAALLLLMSRVASGDLVTQAKTAKPPAPIDQFTKVETWGWRAELPKGWQETLKVKKDAKRLYDGKWGYHSPNKSFRVRVKVHVAKGLPWKDRVKRTLEKLVKRLPDFKLVSSRSTQLNGRETFYMFGSFKDKRNLRTHDYLIFRMLVRFPKRKLRVTMTFFTADERTDDFMKVVEHFTDTFELVEPHTADKAFEQAKKNGIGVED